MIDFGKKRNLSFWIFASGNKSSIIGALSNRALSAVATAASTLLLPRQYPRSKFLNNHTLDAKGSQWKNGVTQCGSTGNQKLGVCTK
jgi:hypothetical protein